jgi:hypothetical protein
VYFTPINEVKVIKRNAAQEAKVGGSQSSGVKKTNKPRTVETCLISLGNTSR